jgi:Domain of unknown function (DUF5615)
MTIRYLLDEHLPKWWRREIVVREPGLEVWRVGDLLAPPLRSSDPVILEWCETHGFVLVTNNRKSMPQHLADHCAKGRHVPGIFVVDPGLNINELAEDLILIAAASLEQEYQDQIRYLPMT